MPSFRRLIPKNNASRAWFGALTAVAIVLLVVPHPAHALDPGSSIALLIANILMIMVKFFASMTGIFVSLLIVVARYNTFLNAEVVVTGWPIVRDLMNMVFIIGLLIIAAGTVLRLQNYRYNRLLGKLIMMALLVNFSKFIAVFLLQFAQVIMLTFVNAFKDIAFGNFSHMFGLDAVLIFANEKYNSGLPDTGNGNFKIAITLLAGLVMMIVSFVVILAICVVLFTRIIALWLLIILSPMAYALRIIPNTEKYASQWWSEFGKYAVVGPVLAFFLWISLALVAAEPNCDTTASVESDSATCEKNPLTTQQGDNKDESFRVALGQADTDTDALRKDFLTEALSMNRMITFVVGIIFLIMGLNYAQKSGGVAGAFAGKVAAAGFGAAAAVTGLNAIRDRTLAPVQGYFKERQNRRQKAITERTENFTRRADLVQGRIAEISGIPRARAALKGAVVAGARAVPGQARQLLQAGIKGAQQVPGAIQETRLNLKANEMMKAAKDRGVTLTPEQARTDAKARLEQERLDAVTAKDVERQEKIEKTRASYTPSGEQFAGSAEKEARRIHALRWVGEGSAAAASMAGDKVADLVGSLGKGVQKIGTTVGGRVSAAVEPFSPVTGLVTGAAGAVTRAGVTAAQAGVVGAAGGWVLGGRGANEREKREQEFRVKRLKEAQERMRPERFDDQQRALMAQATTGDERAAINATRAANGELEEEKQRPDESEDDFKKRMATPEATAREGEKKQSSSDLARYLMQQVKSGEELQKALGNISRDVREAMISGLAGSNLNDGQRAMLADIGGVREAFTKNGKTDDDRMYQHIRHNQDRMIEMLRKSLLSDHSTDSMTLVKAMNSLPKVDDDDVISGTKDLSFAKGWNKTMLKIAQDVEKARKGERAKPENYENGQAMVTNEAGQTVPGKLTTDYLTSDKYRAGEAIIRRTAIGARGGKIEVDELDASGNKILGPDGKPQKVESLKALFEGALTSGNEDLIGNVRKIMSTAGKNFTYLDYEGLKKESEITAAHIVDALNPGAISAMAEKMPKSAQDIADALHKWASGNTEFGKRKAEEHLNLNKEKRDERIKVWKTKNNTIASRETTAGMVSRIGKEDEESGPTTPPPSAPPTPRRVLDQFGNPT